MVDTRLFVVSHRVIYYAEVDMSKELSRNVCYFLVFLVVFNRLVEVFRILLAHFHEVYADAVVCKGLAVDIANGSTNLKELFVLINCRLVLAEIVV